MKASLAICILAALLAVGSCLQCEFCAAEGNRCTGPMHTCAAGKDTCGIFLIERMLGAGKTQSIVKACVTSSECKTGLVSMNFGTGTTRMNSTCCVGEACNTTTVTVPPADTKPNGRRCPGCVALFTDQCTGESIKCTGAETQCIAVTGTVQLGRNPAQVVWKGCASEFTCAQLKADLGNFTGIDANLTTAKCRAASGAGCMGPGATGLLLPALAGFLLLKLLS